VIECAVEKASARLEHGVGLLRIDDRVNAALLRHVCYRPRKSLHRFRVCAIQRGRQELILRVEMRARPAGEISRSVSPRHLLLRISPRPGTAACSSHGNCSPSRTSLPLLRRQAGRRRLRMGPDTVSHGLLSRPLHSNQHFRSNRVDQILALMKSAGFADAQRVSTGTMLFGPLGVNYFRGAYGAQEIRRRK
jgi:hypothetical protein